MLKRVDMAIRDLDMAPATVPADVKAESIELLRWMRDGHFTFLGLADVQVSGDGAAAALAPVEGSGLGLLRNPATPILRRGGQRSEPVARCVARISERSPAGDQQGQRSCRACTAACTWTTSPSKPTAAARAAQRCQPAKCASSACSRRRPTPRRRATSRCLRHKIETVLPASGYPPQSHAGKALVNILDTFPRDELFQIDADDLAQWSSSILDLDMRPARALFARPDRFGRFVSVLLYAPRDRWTTVVREKIGAVLAEACHGRDRRLSSLLPEGPLLRAHFIVATPVPATYRRSICAAVEARITDLMRTWDDRLAAGLKRSATGAAQLPERYAGAFSAAYTETIRAGPRARRHPRIDRLADERAMPVAIDFYRRADDKPSRLHAAIYRFGEPIRLSERVPVLENLGFTVIDERSLSLDAAIPPKAGAMSRCTTWCSRPPTAQPFDLQPPTTSAWKRHSRAVSRGAADNDLFNRLIIAAGATWREAALMRAYASYLRQFNAPFGLRYLAETLQPPCGRCPRSDRVVPHPLRSGRDARRCRGAPRRRSPVRARIDWRSGERAEPRRRSHPAHSTSI